MSCIRPATPGFLITLAATICLAIVTFGVPYLKSIFFLKASLSIDGFSGDVTFGTLGYCLELSNGTTCSKPAVGYQLDINSLVGNRTPIHIPQVVVKWLTYALVLHVVALILSAASALFGLLAHVREMSMACCSTLVSGLAAAVALIAFIFDLIVFFVAKSRISAIGSASLGSALWLTLAAWIMLFFSGCFFTIGRCCVNRRPRGFDNWGKRDDRDEQLRLDAVKAEAERKALQAQPERGLPNFHEVQPLTARVDGDAVYLEPYKDANSATASSAQSARTGYAPAPEGTRAIDDFYHAPSQPRRQNSAATAATSLYNPSVPPTSSPPLPRQPSFHGHYPSASYQSPPQAFGPPLPTSSPPANRYNNNTPQYPQYSSDPYGATTPAYGHGQQSSSYSTVPIHEQQPSSTASYGQYNDPFASHQLQHQSSYDPYNATPAPYTSPLTNQGSFYNSPATATAPQPQRNYTLGGSGYGSPPPPETQPYQSPIPPPINTNVGYVPPTNMSPVKGPRAQPPVQHEEAPPGYDDGTTHWAH